MSNPNDLANTSIYIFISLFAICFIPFLFKIVLGQHIEIINVYLFIIIFYIITFIVQISTNAWITSRKEFCGKTDMGMAFSCTIYPWVFVYGILILLIMLIPGWLRIFSNTFGLYIANTWNLRDLLNNKIFKDEFKNNGNPNDVSTLNLIKNVYNDPTILINELEPTQFNIEKNPDGTISNIIWNSYDKIINSGLFNQTINQSVTNEDKLELHKMVVLKETIGFSVWLFMGGIISVLISINTLLNTKCKVGVPTEYNKIFSKN